MKPVLLAIAGIGGLIVAKYAADSALYLSKENFKTEVRFMVLEVVHGALELDRERRDEAA